ncbi:MAG: SRPBCC domain-containing protein [Bdellovibrionales bacterium]|nr:SRPBCC domain-containing protein [Bdellovibrionales bacterium]
MKFQADTNINSPASMVWKELTNISDWHKWDPNIIKIEGQLALGNKIKIFTKLSDRAFPVKVEKMDPEKQMIFSGGLPFGLFHGKRVFSIVSNGDGTVKFDTTETFTGPLAKVFQKKMPDLTPYFVTFVNGLKNRCESN